MVDTGVQLVTATGEQTPPVKVGFTHDGVCTDAAVQAADNDGHDRVTTHPAEPDAVSAPGHAPSCLTCDQPVDRPPALRR